MILSTFGKNNNNNFNYESIITKIHYKTDF